MQLRKEQYNSTGSTGEIKIYTVDVLNSAKDTRKKYGNAYKSWTDDLDNELRTMYFEGIKLKYLMKHFDRSRGAITSRIKKLGLKEQH